MRGSFTPFVKLYDGFYFTPEHEPADAQYQFEKALASDGFKKKFKGVPFISLDKYCDWKTKRDPFLEHLRYEKIEIVEREPAPKVEMLLMQMPTKVEPEPESIQLAEDLPEEKPKRGRKKIVRPAPEDKEAV